MQGNHVSFQHQTLRATLPEQMFMRMFCFQHEKVLAKGKEGTQQHNQAPLLLTQEQTDPGCSSACDARLPYNLVILDDGLLRSVRWARVPEDAVLEALLGPSDDRWRSPKIHIRNPHWDDVFATVLVPLQRSGIRAVDGCLKVKILVLLFIFLMVVL